jgi:hypothetical protein
MARGEIRRISSWDPTVAALLLLFASKRYNHSSNVPIALLCYLPAIGDMHTLRNSKDSLETRLPGRSPVTMDELRRQLATTQWPVSLRVDGKDIQVGSADELMVPRAGNLICVFEEGAFEVIDCRHIATLRRVKSARRQTS